MRMHTIDITEIRRPTGWSPIRRELGVGAFGVNAWTAEQGKNIVGEHDETQSGQEELYLVLNGTAQFVVDGEERTAGPGVAVLVQPESKRKVVSLEDGTTVLAIGGAVGTAYEPRVWEVSAEVIALFEEDNVPAARALMLESLDPFEGHWIIHYNLACAEARLGETESAFEHLRESLEKRPQLAENAKDDPDLDALRDDARFDELIAGAAVTPG